MGERTNKIVDDYNSGVTLHQIMKHYHLQHHMAKKILLNSGRKLRRIEYMSDEDILNLAETRNIEEMAEWLYTSPETLKRHLKKRNITISKKKSKDEEYIEKQVRYLHFKQAMPSKRIAASLQVDLGRVCKIIKDSRENEGYVSNRMYISSASSFGNLADSLIDFYDLANVFPKQRKYARTY